MHKDHPLDIESEINTVENFLKSQKNIEIGEYVFQYKYTALGRDSTILDSKSNSESAYSTRGEMKMKKLNNIWKLTIKEHRPQSKQSS